MRGKAGKVANWLPNQVVYGIDCSDPDPEKWQSFGSLHEERQAEAAKLKVASAAKSGQPQQ